MHYPISFTDGVRLALKAAKEEAWALDQEYVDTEHILLGLLHAEVEVAPPVLARLGVDVDALRPSLLSELPKGEFGSTDSLGAERPFTQRAKKLLDRALQRSHELNERKTGRGHLLLAMLREREGLAARVLVRHWLSEARLQEDPGTEPPVAP